MPASVACLTCLSPVTAPEGSFCSEHCLNNYIATAPEDCVNAYWDGRATRSGIPTDADITDVACPNCGLTYCGGDCYNLDWITAEAKRLEDAFYDGWYEDVYTDWYPPA